MLISVFIHSSFWTLLFDLAPMFFSFWLGFLFAPLEFCFGFFSVILRMCNHVTAFKKLSTVGTNRHISVPEQHCRYFCSQIVCNWHGLALQYIDNQ